VVPKNRDWSKGLPCCGGPCCWRCPLTQASHGRTVENSDLDRRLICRHRPAASTPLYHSACNNTTHPSSCLFLLLSHRPEPRYVHSAPEARTESSVCMVSLAGREVQLGCHRVGRQCLAHHRDTRAIRTSRCRAEPRGWQHVGWRKWEGVPVFGKREVGG
jgi:hypothetical protein